MKKLPILISVTLFVSGCVSLPIDPNVVVLPGTGRNLEQFRLDDVNCREQASQIARSNIEKYTIDNYAIQHQYDVNYIQCMYAHGHRVPVVGNYTPSQGQPAPMTAPLIPPPPQGLPPAPPPK